ncbi:hypothetical protein pEaSNUABM46_00315 [Erwinia phage pEa_SNUABM_46]|nr:hypothetical protein pEaSNUABM45_00315 [Erwinia phage pEa_SNUABM_45]QYW04299.1 hypothetical protein pEaSNUABM46_00315 [Erwinia phage pEa_SNUABM_46]QYW05330.1 hypothetical protein pEaSNUABM21_00316 [Erwinia phage pEa_SNUABM_21]
MSEQTQLPGQVVIVCVMQESDSFMGQKFDGYVYLLNPEHKEMFERHLQAHKSRENYSRIISHANHYITSTGFDALHAAIRKDANRPWLWSDTDYTITA